MIVVLMVTMFTDTIGNLPLARSQTVSRSQVMLSIAAIDLTSSLNLYRDLSFRWTQSLQVKASKSCIVYSDSI